VTGWVPVLAGYALTLLVWAAYAVWSRRDAP
jgi:hypothetical protein